MYGRSPVSGIFKEAQMLENLKRQKLEFETSNNTASAYRVRITWSQGEETVHEVEEHSHSIDTQTTEKHTHPLP